jgi:hypothetical protein
MISQTLIFLIMMLLEYSHDILFIFKCNTHLKFFEVMNPTLLLLLSGKNVVSSNCTCFKGCYNENENIFILILRPLFIFLLLRCCLVHLQSNVALKENFGYQ